MRRRGGALRILAYNWPVFAATWIAALIVLVLSPSLGFPWNRLAAAGAGAAVAWSLVSLAVSHHVYDRSKLHSGRWIPALLGNPGGTVTWAAIDAGLDAEIDADGAMPGPCLARLDIFDPRFMRSPSIRRARERTPRAAPATSCSPTALPLGNEACDAIVVAFSAHEIRDRGARESFFDELRRALRPGGRVLLVEHLRDLANFLAFGPGFLHFVARREWLRLARRSRLEVAGEARITPWVMALALERPC